jgi:hypothetical protein
MASVVKAKEWGGEVMSLPMAEETQGAFGG